MKNKLSIRQNEGKFKQFITQLSIIEKISLVIVFLFLFLMMFGPNIAPFDPEKPNTEISLQAPDRIHWLGTDENGMDIFSRVIAAPRVDIFVGLVSALLSVAVGIPLGIIAGIFEGARNRTASLVSGGILRLLDVLQAFPVFILAMVLVAIRGRSVGNIITAIAFVNTPVFLRLARTEVLTLRERTYAEAARSIGNTDLSLAFKHLLPNALPPLLSQISVTVGFAILLTAGLSFVGAGIAPPTPELGGMIAGGARNMVLGYWWPALFPGVTLGVIVFCFSNAGDALSRLLEPSQKHSIKEKRVQVIKTKENVSNRLPIINDINCNEYLLEVRDLSVQFFGSEKNVVHALKNISFKVAPGEVVGIIGGPGSGKSILVRSILALPPEGALITGNIYYKGKDILKMHQKELMHLRRNEISHILPGAKSQLNPVIRIDDFMQTVIQTYSHKKKKEARLTALESLKMVGINDPEKRMQSYPHQLSGGMAQRVCIALALVRNPALVVADEPTFGLDVTIQRQILDLMKDLSIKEKFAQIIVTRDLGIVAQYCQRVLVLEQGNLVENDTVQNVFANPQHKQTKQIILQSSLQDIHK